MPTIPTKKPAKKNSVTPVKRFTVSEFLKRRGTQGLTAKEVEMLGYVTNLDDCEVYIKRFTEQKKPIMLRFVRHIKAGLEGIIAADADDFEWKCYEALARYETVKSKIKKRASPSIRIRRSAKTKPLKVILENTVAKPPVTESQGFISLKEFNRLDVSFEMFVLKNSDRFSDKAVANSYRRLSKAGYLKVQTPAS